MAYIYPMKDYHWPYGVRIRFSFFRFVCRLLVLDETGLSNTRLLHVLGLDHDLSVSRMRYLDRFPRASEDFRKSDGIVSHDTRQAWHVYQGKLPRSTEIKRSRSLLCQLKIESIRSITTVYQMIPRAVF